MKFDLARGEFPLYVECLCDERAAFMDFMAARGVQTRANYQPLHTVAHFQDGNAGRAFPNSDAYGSRCVILPCGPDRTAEELETVAGAIGRWMAS